MKMTKVLDYCSFTPGQFFRKEGVVVQIVGGNATNSVLELLGTGQRKTVPIARLLHEYSIGSLIPCNESEAFEATKADFDPDDLLLRELEMPLDDFSYATIKSGLQKIHYIRELENLGYVSLRPTTQIELEYERLVRNKQDSSAPKFSTIYSCWLRIKNRGGDLRAAFPNYKDRGGKDQTRWHPDAELAYNKIAVELARDTKAPIRPVYVERKMIGALRTIVEPPQIFNILPSRSSIERRLPKTFGEYEIYRRQHGQKDADNKYRHWYPRDSATLPLEVVEFDDKDSRCFLWDETTMLPCGRGFVTSGVDQYSKVPLGMSISDLPRNVLSAKTALINAILPSEPSDSNFDKYENAMEFYGRFGIAIFDNALYNHAKELEVCGIEAAPTMVVAWSKPYTPTEKSVVEDFNGRMVSDCFARLPGFGGPKSTNDLLTEGLKSACLSVQDFRYQLKSWVYNEYCNIPRDGYTPRERWRLGMQYVTPRLPKVANALLLATTNLGVKRLRPEGLELLKGLPYQNPELLILRRYLGNNAKIQFRYNPFRLEKIHVFNPKTSKYFIVPSTKPEYTKHLSLSQHKLILKLNKSRGRKHPSWDEVLEERESMTKLVKQLRYSPKRRERMLGKKLANESEAFEGSKKSNHYPVKEDVTELEAVIGDIDAVELDPDEDWAF